MTIFRQVSDSKESGLSYHPADTRKVHHNLSPPERGITCTNQSVSSAPGVGTHHALVSSLGEGVFICLVTFGPAVGDGVAGDRRVVDGQRAFPAHH